MLLLSNVENQGENKISASILADVWKYTCTPKCFKVALLAKS